MASTAALTLVNVVWLTWSCLSLTTSASMKNPVYAMVVATQDMLEDLINDSLVAFAPSLLDIVQSSTPPTLAQLKALPTSYKKQWAVYLLILEKPGCRPLIYIGSATKRLGGVYARFRQYDLDNCLPTYIQQALNDGYTITYKTLLCWAPIPEPGRIYLFRVLFLALESMFSVVLWSLISRTKDYAMPRLCPWKLEDMEYHGLCSHIALIEGIAGQEDGLTLEQIAAKELEQFGDWENTRRKRCKAAKLKSIEKRYYACNLCNFAFTSTWDLDRHNLTQRHINKAGGITKILKNPHQMVWQKNNIDAKTHYCQTCEHAFGCKQKLNVHLATKKHKAKVAAALSESSSSST